MARDVIFCGLRKDFVAQCECLASEFDLRKIVLQKKKILELKLRANSHEVMVNNCYRSRVALQVSMRGVIFFFL